MPRPLRLPYRAFRILLPLLAFGLPACGDGVEPVGGDALACVKELDIHAAAVDRLGLLDHTREPNGNLRQAVGWPRVPFDAGLFGSKLVYDSQQAGWTAAQDPAVAPDVIRVTWYQLSDQTVALPLSERGHIDLTDRGGNATGSRLRVSIIDGASVQLANYTLDLGHTESASTRSESLRANGFVGNGVRQLQITLDEHESVDLATDDRASSVNVDFAEDGFLYAASVTADSTAATGVSTVRFTGSTTLGGVITRLNLDVEERPTVPLAGTGFVTCAGARIAEVEVSGNQMDLAFTRPDGGAFTAAQQTRLGTLVAVLLTPVLSVQAYFS